jgi:hypothetical protein
MNIVCSLYLLQPVKADLYGHHRVVVQIHQKKRISGRCLPFTDTKYDILVCWLLFGITWNKNHVARMGEGRGAYRVLVGRPEGRRPVGRPRRRWENNIKMDLQEVGWGGIDWIDMAQDRDRWLALVSAVMNLRVP